MPSPEFGRAVQGSINDKFGPEGDLRQPKKFADGVHVQFKADSNRASYSLDGVKLPKSTEAVTEAFREALSEDELRAVTGMLHQGASLAVLEQLIFTDSGPIQGQLGAAPTAADKDGQLYATNERGDFMLDQEGERIPGKSSNYTLERTKDGTLKVTIEDRTQLQTCGTMKDGMPDDAVSRSGAEQSPHQDHRRDPARRGPDVPNHGADRLRPAADAEMIRLSATGVWLAGNGLCRMAADNR